MVWHVADSPRRVDKTAVLRFAAHGLRLRHGNFISTIPYTYKRSEWPELETFLKGGSTFSLVND